jgi:hypothetical protein
MPGATAGTPNGSGANNAAADKKAPGLDDVAEAGEEDAADAEEPEASAYARKDNVLGDAKLKVPWLMGVDPGPASEKYQRGDGVDIYIDGAMYLPDNSTLTRVKVAFYSNEKEPCGPVSECYAALGESAMSPQYNHKVELRGSSLNATATCLLRFDTIDSSTRKAATIGYSCFKVFCSKDREQPDSTNTPNIYTNTGLFQIPIYGGRVASVENFSDKMLDTMPKLPCASVLVRIKPAPHSKDGLSVLSCEDTPTDQWQALGLVSSAPTYMSGAYFGKLCEPSDTEAFCFPAKAGSLGLTVDSALNQLLSSVGESDTVKYSRRPDVQGKKGSKEEKIMQDWTASLMPAHKDMKKVLDYQFIAPYSLDTGLNVSIDMLFNMPEAASGFFSTPPVTVYKVIYSIIPPGLFYKDPPMSEGVFYTKSEDYSKSYRAPVFTDGFVHLYPPILDDSTYLLIEVRTITIEPAKGAGADTEPTLTTESKGDLDKSFWTLLPISAQATGDGDPKYLVSGVYQLPLIKGPPPATDLFNSDTQEPLDLVLERLGPKGKAQAAGKKTLGSALKLSDGASVMVRVCNPLFKHVLDFPSLEPHALSADDVHTEIMDTMVSVASRGVTGANATPTNFTFDPKKYTNFTAKNVSVKERLGTVNVKDLKKFAKSVNKSFGADVNINME